MSFPIEGLSDAGRGILASSLWVATWWVFEVLPLAATSLLPIVLFPLSGGLSLVDTVPGYAHKLIILLLAGFLIARAVQRWNLHRRLALLVINATGTAPARLVLGFMAATALLSMWISNTATSVMMLPIGMAVIQTINDRPETPANERTEFGRALMLGIAYAASIGGTATLIGSPTNLVFSGAVEELFDTEISFLDWMKFGLPFSLTLLVLCWLYLTRVAFRLPDGPGEPETARLMRRELQKLGAITVPERRTLLVFAGVAFLWIFGKYTLKIYLPALEDTIVGVAGALLLFLLPAGNGTPDKLLDWDTAKQLPWGVLLLFGGGLTIAAGFDQSGLANWLGEQLTGLDGLPAFALLLAVIAIVNFLTELTSNVATAAVFVPVLAALGLALDVEPLLLMAGACVAASCAFMLPVATPPNAVVFGSGYLRISDMVRTGGWLNVLSILLLTVYVHFFLGRIWGL